MRGLAVLLIVLCAGCAETSVRGRDILRTGPFRDHPGLAARPADGPTKIDAGTNVLTDDELTAAERAVGAAFAAAVQQHGPAPDSALQARLVGCKLDAGSSRKSTVYRARCRAALAIDDEVFVMVESRAERRERSRAITRDEAEALQQQVRDFTLEYEKSVEVMNEAARFAALRLLDPARAVDRLPDDDRPHKPRIPDAEQRARAQQQLSTFGPADPWPDKLAALSELTRTGRPPDVTHCLRHENDPTPRVRAGVGLCLAELLGPGSEAALERLARDPDPDVARAARLGLRRHKIWRAQGAPNGD